MTHARGLLWVLLGISFAGCGDVGGGGTFDLAVSPDLTAPHDLAAMLDLASPADLLVIGADLACSGGKLSCGGACVDVSRDREQCGGCAGAGGVQCAPDAVCSGGTCKAYCDASLVQCGDRCIDPKTDRAFCGATGACGADAGAPGAVCGAGQICDDGACTASCGGATPNLCGTGDTARCVQFTSDTANCGGCDQRCAVGATCAPGAGGLGTCSCPAGTVACGAAAEARCVEPTLCPGGQFPIDCSAIHTAAPALTTGVYTIDPDGSGPGASFAAYCDMSTDGGGWTLALKADGGDAANAARFDYGSPLWSAAPGDPLFTFNAGSADLSLTSAKLDGFNSVAFDQVRLVLLEPSSTVARGVSASLPSAVTSLRAMFGGGTIALPGSRAQWLGLLATPRLQPNCNAVAVNNVGRVRLGIVGNNENECNSPDSYLGLGGASNGCGAVSTFPTVGNGAGCGGVPSDGVSVAFAYVYVRSTNFTQLPSQPSCLLHYYAGHDVSGRYMIDPDAGGPQAPLQVYCDMSSHGGGWTLVHRFTSGVAGDANAIWNGATLNETDASQLGVTPTGAHYLNHIVSTGWNTSFLVSEARVAAYVGGEERAYAVFSAVSSDKLNWFTAARLTGASWLDVAAGQNYFAIAGDVGNRRSWFINKSYAGCGGDAGWLVVTANPATPGPCTWDNPVGGPRVLFADAPTAQAWQGSVKVGQADALAVFVR